MINGGDGGLSIGPLQLDQYHLINKDRPYNSMEEAKRFIQITQNSCYGLGKDRSPVVHPDTKFQITENDGKFYVWYKPKNNPPYICGRHYTVLLNDICNPFSTEEEANNYIQSIKDIRCNTGNDGDVMRIYADFLVTETDGKFHVWATPH